MWPHNTYDNRGFDSLEAKDAFDDYMEKATENGGDWDYLDPDNMYDAIGEYDIRAFKSDLSIFANAYKKGDYRTCADIFYVISENYCNAMAKHEYDNPDFDI
jgi:hypothetical protein